jgi:hypothetical protein
MGSARACAFQPDVGPAQAHSACFHRARSCDGDDGTERHLDPQQKGSVMKDPKLSKEAAQQIDPNTAEVKWENAFSDLADDRWNGWRFFARAPESDVWVPFDDLPDETWKALLRNWRRKDPLVPLTRDDIDEMQQVLIRVAEEFPEMFDDLDQVVEKMDKVVEQWPDGRGKARWRSTGREKTERLVEVLKRKVEGRKPD